MSTRSKQRSRTAAQHRASSTARSPSRSTARAASHNGIAGEEQAVPSRRPPTRTRIQTRGYGQGRRGAALSFRIKLAAVVGVAVVALAVIFVVSRGSSTSGTSTGQYAYTVGDPGPGTLAPAIQLPSTAGGTFGLSALRGKTVLLYFQEGLTCQPCWDQLKDIDSHMGQFRALGIDEVVSITTDQLGPIQQKIADEGITSPVLSDAMLSVSTAYHANQYGMMGTSRDGHTFIVVGPDGRIHWRADFGGAPNYTMYVPIPNLIADLRQGMSEALTGEALTAGGSAGNVSR